jgi:serine/threonine protein kinase
VIGRTLARYRITAAIGAGGMGEVCRATDTKLGRDVALKVLPAEMAASAERLERFQRDLPALADAFEDVLKPGAIAYLKDTGDRVAWSGSRVIRYPSAAAGQLLSSTPTVVQVLGQPSRRTWQ